MGQTNERATAQVTQDPTVAIPEGCVFEDVCNVVWSFTDGAPFLYLGNKWSALFPIDEYNKRNITHIVNVTENEINMHEKTLQYLKISVPDEEKVDIKEHFDRTYQFIKEAYNNKQSVLVHVSCLFFPNIIVLCRYEQIHNNCSFIYNERVWSRFETGTSSCRETKTLYFTKQ